MEQKVVYHEDKKKDNTEDTLEATKRRVEELKIKDVLIASTHGNTALKAAKVFKGTGVNLLAVSICHGWAEEGWVMTPQEKKKLETKGVKVLTCSHALGDGVASAFTEKFGGKSIEEVVAQTLYRFSQGMKVCVEIAMMAADAGLISVENEVAAVAGTSKGADTAIVLKPAYPRKFHELEIKEIIAKPRDP
jgi:hypothetical protein